MLLGVQNSQWKRSWMAVSLGPASACTFLCLSFSVCEKREGFPDTPVPAILDLLQLRTLLPARGSPERRRPRDAGGGAGRGLLGPPPPKLLLAWLGLRVARARWRPGHHRAVPSVPQPLLSTHEPRSQCLPGPGLRRRAPRCSSCGFPECVCHNGTPVVK